MAYPNQRIQAPFGDIYFPDTHATDKIAARLVQQDQQEKIQREREQKALDDNFSKELANVKAADIPDIVNLYGDYRNASIDVNKKGVKGTPQDSYDLLQKKAAMYRGINASVEDKTRLKGYLDAHKADKKGLYDENATKKVTEWLNTPTKNRTPENDGDSLFYKYAVPDLDKELKVARGTPKDITIVKGVNPNDPLKDDKEVYKVGNTPNQFYGNLFNGLATDATKAKNFSGLQDAQHSDAEKEELTNKYIAKIHDPAFIALYGETKPFPDAAMQTKLGQAVALKTMEEVVNTPIAPAKIISEPNTERTNKNKQDAATLAFNRRRELEIFKDGLIRGRNKDKEIDDISQVGYPTNKFEKDYGKDIPFLVGGLPSGTKRVVYVDDLPVQALRSANPQDVNKGIFPVEPKVDESGKKYFDVQKDKNGNIDLVGKDGKLGAEDVRNNFIKENTGTSFKLKVNTNKPGAAKSSSSSNKVKISW